MRKQEVKHLVSRANSNAIMFNFVSMQTISANTPVSVTSLALHQVSEVLCEIGVTNFR